MFFRSSNKKEHFLVTNRHVLKNKVSIELHLNFYNSITKNYTYDNKVNILLRNAVHFHDKYDLAALSLKFLDDADTVEKIYAYSSIGIGMIPDDFNIFANIQNIFMMGYPDGIYNKTCNLPIVRSGITATPIMKNHDDMEEFVVDIPSIGGSSGSPVLAEVKDKLYLVGILYCMYSRKIEVDKCQNRLYHSRKFSIRIDTQLGCAVRSNQLLELINTF